MKTTLELPDSLMHRIKLLAAERGEKLKDLVAHLLESALKSERGQPARIPTPVKLRGRSPLTVDEIEEAISEGRE